MNRDEHIIPATLIVNDDIDMEIVSGIENLEMSVELFYGVIHLESAIADIAIADIAIVDYR